MQRRLHIQPVWTYTKKPTRKRVRSRALYAMLALAVIASGLLWRSGFIPMPQWLSNYGGDALWALMVFVGFGFLFPRLPVHRKEKTLPRQEEATTQVTTQVEALLRVMKGEQSREEIQERLNLANREHFRKGYLVPALEAGLIERTIPDKPNSRLQKYRLTAKGRSVLS